MTLTRSAGPGVGVHRLVGRGHRLLGHRSLRGDHERGPHRHRHLRPAPPPTHELTVAKAGAPADGTVTSAPTGIDCGPTCSHDFAAGSDVTLTATADTGSTFTGWSGSGISCSGTGTCTVALNADEIVTATFNSVPAGDHALSVAKTGNGSGTVTSAPAGIACGTTCSAAFPAGSSVTLTAAPAAGAAFAGWSGAGCSGTGTCVVTMSADQSVTATFNLTTATPTLSVAKTGNGSGTVTSAPAGIACGTTCSAGLPAGSSVTLTAEPDQGSELTGWSGSGISCPGTGPCVVAMNADQSVTATFNPVVLKPFPRANVSYPNAAIVTFGADHYVFAGGRAFQASASELAAVQKVDPAKVVAAPGGTPAPISVAPRPGVTVFTQPVNGNVTIYVIGTDGELHPFATPTQFFRDGYNGALVITVPNLGGLTVGSNAGNTLTALVTKADGAIVNSSGTFYTFAGGRAFGIPTPAALQQVRKTNSAVELQGSVPSADTGAPMADGVVLSVAGPVYVSYVGELYPFKTTTQLDNTGYGGTPAVPAPHTGGLTVVFPYSP